MRKNGLEILSSGHTKDAPVCGGDTGLKHYGREGSLSFTFVQLSAKPQGAFTVKMYEEFTSSMHNQLQVEDIFMNPRVTLETNSLLMHIGKFRKIHPSLVVTQPCWFVFIVCGNTDWRAD